LENEEHFGEFKPVGNEINELKINYAKVIEFTLRKLREKSLFF
jgi:putative component of toxin-antitoxin plasmid stabilization module